MSATCLALLDTNIISDLMKHGSQSRVLAQIERVGASGVWTSSIVAAEILYGVEKKGSAPLRENAERLLSEIRIAEFDRSAASAYGTIRADLERRGTPIGANDMLIAAQAFVLGATLITDNVREFARVPLLVVENWLDPQFQPTA